MVYIYQKNFLCPGDFNINNRKDSREKECERLDRIFVCEFFLIGGSGTERKGRRSDICSCLFISSCDFSLDIQ